MALRHHRQPNSSSLVSGQNSQRRQSQNSLPFNSGLGKRIYPTIRLPSSATIESAGINASLCAGPQPDPVRSHPGAPLEKRPAAPDDILPYNLWAAPDESPSVLSFLLSTADQRKNTTIGLLPHRTFSDKVNRLLNNIYCVFRP